MQTNKFCDDLKNQITYQYDRYKIYKTICQEKSISREDIQKIVDNRELYKLPPIYALRFKKSYDLIKELNDMEKKDGTFVISSSTYGDPSYIYCSKNDLEIIRNNYKNHFAVENSNIGLAFSPPMDILYKAGEKKSIYNKKTLLRITTAAEGNKYYYDLKDMLKLDISCLINKVFNKKNFKPKFKPLPKSVIENLFKNTEKEKNNIVLGGISLLLYPTITNYFNNNNLNLSKQIFFVTSGGGWTGKKGTIETKELKKTDFINGLSKVFKIDLSDLKNQFRDVYAFCESSSTHLGHWNNEIGDYIYKPTSQSVAYAVDPKTLLPVKEGEKGLFQVITPYGCEYSATCNILQGDLVKAHKLNPDGSLKEFTNISRMPGLEIEGCAYETKGLVGDIIK